MLRILCLIATFAFTAAAEQRRTAFEAYALVPREVALRLARVAACEGTRQPERWHFIVHDPEAENGLRDYVIADGEVAATNGVSQFAGEVRPEDVLGLKSVFIDSTYIAQVANRYAAANRMSIASLNYDLHKESSGVAVWKVTCLDSANRPLGWLVIDAVGGKVTQGSGFEITPSLQYDNVPGEPTSRNQEISPPVGGFQRRLPPVASKDPFEDDLDVDAPVGGFQRRPRDTEAQRAEPKKQPPPQRRRIEVDPFRQGRRLFPF
jgi:hypothetical protein